jgi:DNA-binding NarL/FixJ family response regulator
VLVEGHRGTLVISVKTVERHRANMLQKLGMRDRLSGPLRHPAPDDRTVGLAARVQISGSPDECVPG